MATRWPAYNLRKREDGVKNPGQCLAPATEALLWNSRGTGQGTCVAVITCVHRLTRKTRWVITFLRKQFVSSNQTVDNESAIYSEAHHSHPTPRGLRAAMLAFTLLGLFSPRLWQEGTLKTAHQMPKHVFHCMYCYLNNTHRLRLGYFKSHRQKGEQPWPTGRTENSSVSSYAKHNI